MPHARPILVDERIGSRDLLEPLRALHLPVEKATLDAADVAFEGDGPEGPMLIGIERKKIRDLLDSKRSGRLAGHQLINLLRDYQTVYLVIEGPYRPNPDTGVLEIPTRRGWETLRLGKEGFLASELQGFLLGLEQMANVKIRWTFNRAETVSLIQEMWTWWGVRWGDHHSLKVVYTPPPPVVQMTKPSFERRVASQIDGIGWEKSGRVEEKFRSVAAMVAADEREWQTVPGVGKTLAKRIVRTLRGER
jgi:ERCC4-type nuclease